MSPVTRAATLVLAVALIGAANVPNAVGFAKLGTLVASHPLAPMLAQYDREIAALRSTAAIADLRDAAQQAQRSALVVQHRAAAGVAQVGRIAQAPSQRDEQTERVAFADIATAQRAGDSALPAYREELFRETGATLRDYAAAILQRNARALAAREQQLREAE
ncbi:MAG: hypothetical protein JO263_06730, partial [Candidatus Eremiobacteraeota bacterium]|nr:hypothetical protein [Candidatus Eremiobacteraeota bacterium]